MREEIAVVKGGAVVVAVEALAQACRNEEIRPGMAVLVALEDLPEIRDHGLGADVETLAHEAATPAHLSQARHAHQGVR